MTFAKTLLAIPSLPFALNSNSQFPRGALCGLPKFVPISFAISSTLSKLAKIVSGKDSVSSSTLLS